MSWLWLLLAWVCSPALAGEARVGLFIGADHGRDSDAELVFASADAQKMHALFVQTGQLPADRVELLIDPTRGQLERALRATEARIDAAKERGDRSLLILYYSGHGDEEALFLGEHRLQHAELRDWMEATGADVRLALFDACQSGGAVRNKGGVRGPGFDVDVGLERVQGTAILTSSAASELSQESDEIGGGFFTHFVHSALSGAGDANGDGEVTLQETYDFVYGETIQHTRHAPGSQTPSFDYDLRGAGELVLTRLDEASAALLFPGGMPGPYAVWDESRRRYVAEIDGEAAGRIAVRPGVYYVHRRLPGWVDEAQYVLQAGEARTVDASLFRSVAYEDTASRGDLDRAVRQAQRPEMSLFLLAGVRGFREGTVYDSQYLPRHAVGGIQLRLHHRSGLDFGIDLLSGSGSRALDFPELGDLGVVARSASLGGEVGWVPRLGPVHAGLAFRGELIGLFRDFVDESYASQSSWGVAPGLATRLGLNLGPVAVELGLNILVLPVQWDDQDWPAYSEGLLSVGYRF